jgi:hypothetical protein
MLKQTPNDSSLLSLRLDYADETLLAMKGAPRFSSREMGQESGYYGGNVTTTSYEMVSLRGATSV